MKKIILITLIISFIYPDRFIEQMLQERRAREYKAKMEKINKKNRARVSEILYGTTKIIYDYINKTVRDKYNECIEINHLKRDRLKIGKTFVKAVDKRCYNYAIRENNEKNNNKPRIKKDMNIKVSDDTIDLSIKNKKKKKFKLKVTNADNK